MRKTRHFLYTILALSLGAVSAFTADWPSYRGGFTRSGISDDALGFSLHEAWRRRELQPPAHAWPDPAPRDYWHYAEDLKPRAVFDRAFHVSIADGLLLYGNSSDDVVRCIDALTGEPRWTFQADGPVRLSPSIEGGRVYFGADDGAVYCLDLHTGLLLWRYNAAPEPRIIPGNQRMISPWAVRTGVAVIEGEAYFAAGLFPEEGVFLYCLDAASGTERWKRPIDVSPQGFILATESRLYLPQGRSTPAVFDRRTGDYLFTLGGGGGAFALIAGGELVHGPGASGSFDEVNPENGDRLSSFAGDQILVTGERSYLLANNELAALDRVRYNRLIAQRAELQRQRRELAGKLRNRNETDESVESGLRKTALALAQIEKDLNDCFAWKSPCELSSEMILAQNAVVAGGQNRVAAYDMASGSPAWSAAVEGNACGLAIAEGRLYVSTDRGLIYCFASGDDAAAADRSPAVSAPPSPDETALRLTDAMLSVTETRQGYALLMIDDALPLAAAMIERSGFSLVCSPASEKTSAALREPFVSAGLYGRRLSVFQRPRPEFADYVFNAIAVDDALAKGRERELLRSVRPFGGVIFIHLGVEDAPAYWRDLAEREFDSFEMGVLDADPAWAWIRRGSEPGGGEWSHPFADAGNTASSGDRLVRAPLRPQWFGRPGPRLLVDRHHRATPPVVARGRGFLLGDEHLFAFDAYNGTPLWDRDLPGSRRVGVPFDAGNLMTDGETVYVLAGGECLRLRAADGESLDPLPLPETARGMAWGWMAYMDGVVYGSAEPAAASRTALSRDDVVEMYNQFRPIPLSRMLFAYRADDGALLWTHPAGSVPNIAIAAGDGCVFFVESRAPEMKRDSSGRAPLRELLASGAFLVCLDASSGETRWEVPVELPDCHHVLYLQYKDGVLIATGSYNREDDNAVWYSLNAFDARGGAALWRRDHANTVKGVGGDHGEQVHHPTIVGDYIVAEPRAYEIHTGEPLIENGEPWLMSKGRAGCGTISSSALNVFYRDSNPMMNPLFGGAGETRVSSVNRTGCWINMIAAGGVLLVPEASSGCTCNYAIQASMAFAPAR
ncbi:MAG: PQQ-binding-like beta-propeller repeat protein [bacterium]|nr:PQQ-binding-like beta-propeller repeat protein [bacterium]